MDATSTRRLLYPTRKVPCVVFVRSKEPLADALALAREIDLPMLKTPYTMFEACARLYTAGLRPVELG